mmetsp:Transcript_17940/g.61966  ORF Transcript_17940/g.61966 Transcript_17940/m.61966 type:complete len:241 (-) Transcript_17940:176-898(-)
MVLETVQETAQEMVLNTVPETDSDGRPRHPDVAPASKGATSGSGSRVPGPENGDGLCKRLGDGLCSRRRFRDGSGGHVHPASSNRTPDDTCRPRGPSEPPHGTPHGIPRARVGSVAPQSPQEGLWTALETAPGISTCFKKTPRRVLKTASRLSSRRHRDRPQEGPFERGFPDGPSRRSQDGLFGGLFGGPSRGPSRMAWPEDRPWAALWIAFQTKSGRPKRRSRHSPSQDGPSRRPTRRP